MSAKNLSKPIGQSCTGGSKPLSSLVLNARLTSLTRTRYRSFQALSETGSIDDQAARYRVYPPRGRASASSCVLSLIYDRFLLFAGTWPACSIYLMQDPSRDERAKEEVVCSCTEVINF